MDEKMNNIFLMLKIRWYKTNIFLNETKYNVNSKFHLNLTNIKFFIYNISKMDNE